jgi:hypothetical protein
MLLGKQILFGELRLMLTLFVWRDFSVPATAQWPEIGLTNRLRLPIVNYDLEHLLFTMLFVPAVSD